MKPPFRRLILFLLFSALIPFSANAQKSSQQFSNLQEKYLSIRNIDISVKQPARWQALAQEFEEFAKKHHSVKQAGQAIFNAAIIYEELYRIYQQKSSLSKCIALFESIPRDFPGDAFADDALLRVGDVFAKSLKNTEEAKRRYKEIIEAYPDSDIVAMAKSRLKNLERGSQQADQGSAKDFSSTLPLVIIDPGHGGEDFGAVGSGGLLEKDVVLDVALRLHALIDREGIYSARLTRRSDKFVPLKERTNFANDFDAKLFISLHVNSNPSTKVSGLETYYLDNTNDKSSQSLAKRENQYFADSGDISDLNFMLSDLIQNAKLGDSIVLANIIQSNLIKRMTEQWGKQRNLGVKKAPFYVLVGVHIPCALAEMYFINHGEDERNLSNAQFRQSLAEGLNAGIKEYLLRENPE